MLLPLQFGSGGVYCGIATGGSGCSVGVCASSTIIQRDFSAGIVLKLGRLKLAANMPTRPLRVPLGNS